jgi:hypothetical protein
MVKKYVVFDLDETLGYFTELGIIWSCLETVYNASGQESFNELCRVFEKEYFRPGIFKAMRFLKEQGNDVRVVLYTNNTGSVKWLKLLLSYIEERSGAGEIFHKIVPGYRPGMKGSHARTSFNKTYSEIIRCNVTYINVRPFFHPLRATYIIEKLQTSYFRFMDYSSNSYLYKCIRNFHNNYISNGHHKRSTRISKDDIIEPLRIFLNKRKRTIKRVKKSNRSKTRKGSKSDE